jgi:hypothetical protein
VTLWQRLTLFAADLVRVNSRYLVDPGRRNQLREALKNGRETRAQFGVAEKERAAAPTAALAYAGLAATSLSLAGIRPEADHPGFNLLIGEIRPGQLFAGAHTAVTVAKALSERLGLPLRVVTLDFSSPDRDSDSVRGYLAERYGLPQVSVVSREKIQDASFGANDIWLATHSKTAHAAQVACVAGVIDVRRVLYLIQDYEPGFSAWSTASVVANATYHAGFLPIVNSSPLAEYLRKTEGIEINDDLVFAPAFDDKRLRESAGSRRHNPVTVFFYARPSKPRNLYALGIAALRAAVSELGADATGVRFVSAGEPHPNVNLGNGCSLVSLGRLEWASYFELLSSTSVALSLQASPHPSHPPFDAAISGSIAITNDFGETRTRLHPRLHAVPPDVPSLAAALVDAVRSAPGASSPGYLPVKPGILGRPLDDVIATLAGRFESR